MNSKTRSESEVNKKEKRTEKKREKADFQGYQLHAPASKWQDGCLCGNGSMGAIVMGKVCAEQIILTREDFFAPLHGKEKALPMAQKLPQIRSLIKAEKYKEAGAIPWKLLQETYPEKPEKLWTNPFFPACDVAVFTKETGIYEKYERSLSFTSGTAKVSFFTGDGKERQRKVLVSQKYNACLAELIAKNGAADYRIELQKHPYEEEEFGPAKEDVSALLKAECYSIKRKAAESDRLGELELPSLEETSYFLLFRGYFQDEKGKDAGTHPGQEGKLKGYAAMLQLTAWDGWVQMEKDALVLKENTRALLKVILHPLEDFRDFEPEFLMERLEGIPDDFQQVREENEADMGERFRRISLSLEDSKRFENDRALYQNARFAGKASPSYLQKIFDAGRYEILSSCGEYPPNLQGVWAGSYHVPWSSDYTQNGNLQTAIAGLLPCGDFEGMHSFFSYQEKMMPDYRENARRLYGCRGIHIPSRTSDSGCDIHFDEGWPMLFWTAGAGWTARFFYDYWLYTGDDGFFKEHALPFMEEAALFYEDFLIKDEKGQWLFSPSHSPENTPDGQDSAVCTNATMDISVAKELFSNLITGCRTLGIEEEKVKKWKEILAGMPEYRINEDGALKEWEPDEFKDCYDHRHISQLYLLYYDIPEEVRESRELFDACKKAYEIKMQRKQKEKGTMAFGLVLEGFVAAHLKDAEMTEELLQTMACSNYYQTFASAHDFGPSIFNADISGGVPALMLHCLAQSFPVTDERGRISHYEIRLLPAVPDSMKSGSVTGMRLRGGFILSMEWKEKKLKQYQIENPGKNTYVIQTR